MAPSHRLRRHNVESGRDQSAPRLLLSRHRAGEHCSSVHRERRPAPLRRRPSSSLPILGPRANSCRVSPQARGWPPTATGRWAPVGGGPPAPGGPAGRQRRWVGSAISSSDDVVRGHQALREEAPAVRARSGCELRAIPWLRVLGAVLAPSSRRCLAALARETLRAAPRTCVSRLSHGMARSHPMARARNASGGSKDLRFAPKPWDGSESSHGSRAKRFGR